MWMGITPSGTPDGAQLHKQHWEDTAFFFFNWETFSLRTFFSPMQF